MYKGVGILTVIITLVSGLHLNLTQHYCEGKPADFSISLTGKEATCGMEGCVPQKNPEAGYYSNNCCENYVFEIESGDYNNTPSFNINFPDQKSIPSFENPGTTSTDKEYNTRSLYLHRGPPYSFSGIRTSNSFTCIFRI